jgi:hypothetical protein
MTDTKISLEDRVQWYLASADRQAATTQSRFSDNVEKYGLPYALEWAAGVAVDIYVRDLWMAVLNRVTIHGQTMREALTAQVQYCTEQLIRDYVHQSSTSAYSNATAAEKAQAYARFVEQGQGTLDHDAR